VAIAKIIGISVALVVKAVSAAQIAVGGRRLYEKTKLLSNRVDGLAILRHEITSKNVHYCLISELPQFR